MKKHTKIHITGVFLISLILASCATIFKGGHGEVRFNSSPSGADVLINQVNKGETPTTAQLSRKESHTVTFKKEGYEDVTVRINRKFDGATTILGNIVSWALLGIVVDVASGAAYTLTPADVDANLNKLQAAGIIDKEKISKKSENTVHVFMLTKEQWKKIQSKN